MELTDDDASEERTVASEELKDFSALINKTRPERLAYGTAADKTWSLIVKN
jgi:hypothetical protein